MKTLNVVFAVAGLFALVPSASLWAGEKADGTCSCETDGAAADVTTRMRTGGGKASRSHAQAREAKAEADKAAELRAAKRAEERARKIAAGEKTAVAAPVATEPVKVPAGNAGKASNAHARARAAKAAADKAAALDAE